MFTINGTDYEFKFSVKRIDLIEQKTGKSLITTIRETDGAYSVNFINACFGYALKNLSNSDIFVDYKTGVDIAERAIEEFGFFKVSEMISESLQRDIPFFFRAG